MNPGSPRRLAVQLVVAFALTVACFVTGTVVAEYRARGIESAAQSIANVAVPAIDHVARARSELRHVEVLLDDFAHGGEGAAPATLLETRQTFEREYDAYLALPPYRGERALLNRIATRTTEMNASIDAVLRSVEHGQDASAELAKRTKPAIDRVDAALLDAVALNTGEAATLSARIASIKNAARAWGLALDALSLLFSAVAAVLVVRVVVRYVRLMEARASDHELFAARVAHDIRSPLQSVALALDLTRERHPELDPKTTSMLDRGTRTLQRVGQLVDGLLVFAKAGRQPSDEARADVAAVVVDVVEQMRPAAEEKDIELHVAARGSPVVSCSPGVLVSIVANLVGNAIKYMGTGTLRRVDVRVIERGGAVRVEVRDTGPGVPAALRERIFDPFVGSAESTAQGIGLGLATVRRLVEAHAGSVGVEANPDVGSLFWVELPRALTSSAAPRPRSLSLRAVESR
jgi:signal transduction histidine kinase